MVFMLLLLSALTIAGSVHLYTVLGWPPTRIFNLIFKAWMRLVRLIGDFQARVVLALLYVLLLLPKGLVAHLDQLIGQENRGP